MEPLLTEYLFVVVLDSSSSLLRSDEAQEISVSNYCVVRSIGIGSSSEEQSMCKRAKK